MSEEKDLVSLSALNARFIHNYITNDVDSHDRIIHQRFTLISSAGRYQARADYLNDWATGFHPDVVPYFDLRDERIEVFGDTALVRATNKHTFVVNGEETTGMTTYTDTYVRENGEWLCIQAQLTAVAREHYPPDSTIITQYVRGEQQAP